MNKLKPFFDTFTGPYKDNASFWTGLLLVVRLILLVVHTIDYEDFSTPFTIGILIFFLLSAIMVSLNGVYKKHCLNILEYFMILSMGIMYTVNIETKIISKFDYKVIINHLSVGLVFLTFLGIISYHIYLKFLERKNLKSRFGSSGHYDDFDVKSFEGMRGYENESTNGFIERIDNLVNFPPINNPDFIY